MYRLQRSCDLKTYRINKEPPPWSENQTPSFFNTILNDTNRIQKGARCRILYTSNCPFKPAGLNKIHRFERKLFSDVPYWFTTNKYSRFIHPENPGFVLATAGHGKGLSSAKQVSYHIVSMYHIMTTKVKQQLSLLQGTNGSSTCVSTAGTSSQTVSWQGGFL